MIAIDLTFKIFIEYFFKKKNHHKKVHQIIFCCPFIYYNKKVFTQFILWCVVPLITLSTVC